MALIPEDNSSGGGAENNRGKLAARSVCTTLFAMFACSNIHDKLHQVDTEASHTNCDCDNLAHQHQVPTFHLKFHLRIHQNWVANTLYLVEIQLRTNKVNKNNQSQICHPPNLKLPILLQEHLI